MAMKTHSATIPADIVKSLRVRVREATRDEDHGDRKRPEGLYLAAFDPNRLLTAFEHVRLRPGFRLASHQHHSKHGGHGSTFVVPEGQSLPDPNVQSPGGRPERVRTDIETFIDGDGSDLSYFETSMLSREVRELGAWWHGIEWGSHSLMVVDPFKDGGKLGDTPKERWAWRLPRPRSWAPRVRHDRDGRVTVEFVTYCGFGRDRLLRHVDRYGDSYSFESGCDMLAEGEGGYNP